MAGATRLVSISGGGGTAGSASQTNAAPATASTARQSR